MVSALAGTSARCSALRRAPSRTTAAMTPTRPPRPPKMETPPSSTAATTASSRPVPLSARALAKRSVQKTPARRGHRAGHDEEPELGAGDPDAGEAGRLGVVAHGVQRRGRSGWRAARPRRSPPARATTRIIHGIGVPGIGADRPARSSSAGSRRPRGRRARRRPAPVERERADGDGERRQAEHGDEEPVDRAEHRAEQQAERR